MSNKVIMKKNPKRKRRLCELHACLKHILSLCRWTGHFPVESLHNPRAMRFNLKSMYMAYYVFTWIALAHNTAVSIHKYFFVRPYHKGDLTSDMVNLNTIVVTALMYRMAKHWSALVQDATDTEQSIGNIVKVSSHMHVKCTTLSYAVAGLGFVEHLFYTNFKLQVEVFCSGHGELNMEVFDRFLKHHYYSVFDYLPFYRWLGILAEFLKFQNSIMWNVTDIIGMCFSIYLNSYFCELGKIIKSDMPKDWGKIRACYSRLVVLLNLINEQLAPFIFLTSLGNLFFICRQLYSSLHEDVSDQKIPECDKHFDDRPLGRAYLLYYVFSLLFLIIRSMGFVYMATNVHTSANQAMLPLFEVPSSEYNNEVEYFQMQLRYTTVGLNGIFFYVERRTILRVIATIVTYELVLLQFSLPRKPANFDLVNNLTMQLYRGIF